MSTPAAPPPYSNYQDYQQFPTQQQQQQPPIPINQYPQSHPTDGSFHTVPHVTVVSQQPSSVVVHTIPILGPLPVSVTCNHCYTFTTTRINHEISTRTHCCALGLCLVGLWPCVILPYFCGGCCKKTIHTCSNCGRFIGSY